MKLATIHAWLQADNSVACPPLRRYPNPNLACEGRFQKSHADHDPGEIVLRHHFREECPLIGGGSVSGVRESRHRVRSAGEGEGAANAEVEFRFG